MSFLFDKLFNNKQGIVNVRMVITEEKILSNIEKVQKMINPKSKKQIVQLEEDTYFKDLVESIKTYLEEYPKKKNFPRSVYKAAYDLVEFATNQFEENTKKIEELIIQREKNISLAFELKTTLSKVLKKEEGFEKIAYLFEEVAKIEKEHEKRYMTLLGNINDDMVFKKGEETVWICRNCGHVYVGDEAPKVCPVCNHPQSYFEKKSENY